MTRHEKAQRNAEIIAQAQAGGSSRQIGARFNLDHTTVSWILRQAGVRRECER